MVSKKMYVITLIITLSCLALANTTDCPAMSHDGTCDFYVKCLEDKYQCGPSGYPIGYGFKYCSKFVKYINEFPPKGQEWITKTLVCLKGALITEFPTCQDVYEAAFNSHPRCYYEAGFCDLFLDTAHVKDTIVALLKVYEVQDFASLTALKQIYETATLCGADYLNKLIEILQEIFEQKFLDFLPLDQF